jgi:hypothetical protein
MFSSNKNQLKKKNSSPVLYMFFTLVLFITYLGITNLISYSSTKQQRKNERRNFGMDDSVSSDRSFHNLLSRSSSFDSNTITVTFDSNNQESVDPMTDISTRSLVSLMSVSELMKDEINKPIKYLINNGKPVISYQPTSDIGVNLTENDRFVEISLTNDEMVNVENINTIKNLPSVIESDELVDVPIVNPPISDNANILFTSDMNNDTLSNLVEVQTTHDTSSCTWNAFTSFPGTSHESQDILNVIAPTSPTSLFSNSLTTDDSYVNKNEDTNVIDVVPSNTIQQLTNFSNCAYDNITNSNSNHDTSNNNNDTNSNYDTEESVQLGMEVDIELLQLNSSSPNVI